ncbi:alanine aminotransferase 2-like [Acanthochromis polyacanthus]|uniref:alanine aminotransferase 2-like n=1 Tax=Acanthochromis polyacanthus TaxID=80966 RepID=UPI002234CADE|nr:alanine aminotransferase 2-like [Acanthochromis polyacanthus]
MSVLQEISQNVRNIKQLEYAALARRATQIQKELSQGVRKPYKELTDVCWGDPHSLGVKPLTFVRQVLAACVYPELMSSHKLPLDVRQRAQWLLGKCEGGSIGSYPASAGIPEIIQRMSKSIARRDGGVPCNPENVFISPGSQWSLTNIIHVLVNDEAPLRTGILIPVPCHVTTITSITSLGAAVVPYFLSEEHGWALQVEELQRALESAKGGCNPIALYVINPGNPAGYVQSRKSIQEVIRFASEKRLVLLADEVYQDCVYGKNSEFVSYKKVLAEMGPPFSDTVELASFHSVSKGFMGECGLRGGYVELVNLDPNVVNYISNLNYDTTSVLAQFALDLMMNPPRPGDPSYPLYNQQTQDIKNMLVQNVKMAHEVVNSLPGLSCQPVEGGAFVFPRVLLPPRAIQKAKEEGMQPDTFYCMRLLEETGVLITPGCEYRQKEGTYHIRFCIMASQDTINKALKHLATFHTKFMKDFS